MGFSSIYYLLKKLEKGGLIEGQLEEAERGPARWEPQRPLVYFVEAMFDCSVTLIRAEMEWIEKFIHIMEEQNDQD